jgi:hypothetical protein
LRAAVVGWGVGDVALIVGGVGGGGLSEPDAEETGGSETNQNRR